MQSMGTRKDKMKKIKYSCIECNFQYLIVQRKKDILENKKYDDKCPKCHKQMIKSDWTDTDIRLSEATDLIMGKDN